jgi:FMN-dependent NADH-azoreductase
MERMMTKILLVQSSPRGAASVSSMLAGELLERLMLQHPGAEVLLRDLAAQPLPHIGSLFASGTLTAPDARSREEVAALLRSDEVLAELQSADIVIVAAAMINFGIPSELKSWIDHLMRVGMAFTYNEQGPLGLVAGKRLYLVLSRGSAYLGNGMQDWDFQLPYLEKIFQFMGITDQQHIVAEGMLAGEELAGANLAKAREQIAAIGK